MNRVYNPYSSPRKPTLVRSREYTLSAPLRRKGARVRGAALPGPAVFGGQQFSGAKRFYMLYMQLVIWLQICKWSAFWYITRTSFNAVLHTPTAEKKTIVIQSVIQSAGHRVIRLKRRLRRCVQSARGAARGSLSPLSFQPVRVRRNYASTHYFMVNFVHLCLQ